MSSGSTGCGLSAARMSARAVLWPKRHKSADVNRARRARDLGLIWLRRVRLLEHFRQRKCVSQEHLGKCVQVLRFLIRVLIRPVYCIISFKPNMLRPLFHGWRNDAIGQTFDALFEIDSRWGGLIDISCRKFNRAPEHRAGGIGTALPAEIVETGKKCRSYFRRYICRSFWRSQLWICRNKVARRSRLAAHPSTDVVWRVNDDCDYSLTTPFTL